MSITLMPGMTLEQQIEGTRRAVKSLESNRRGPTWLIPSLKKRLRLLIAEKKRRTSALGTTQLPKKSVRDNKRSVR